MGDEANITAVRLTEAQRRKVLPKFGCSLGEVHFMIGSSDLVGRMRRGGWLNPACEQPLLFDAGHVAAAWARILQGEKP